MCFGLTAMFVKMKIYFYCRNFAKKTNKHTFIALFFV